MNLKEIYQKLGVKMTSTNRRRGKDAERKIAEMFEGKRIGIMGGEDVMHPYFSIEVKSRKAFIGEK